MAGRKQRSRKAGPAGSRGKPDMQTLRARIDSVDAQLHELINARARLAQQVGISKHRDGKVVDFYRPEREAQVRHTVCLTTKRCTRFRRTGEQANGRTVPQKANGPTGSPCWPVCLSARWPWPAGLARSGTSHRHASRAPR